MSQLPADPNEPSTSVPDATSVHLDPDGLQGAHGRTGRLLKAAGLPFEDEEFEEGETSARDGQVPDDAASTTTSDDAAADPQ